MHYSSWVFGRRDGPNEFGSTAPSRLKKSYQQDKMANNESTTSIIGPRSTAKIDLQSAMALSSMGIHQPNLSDYGMLAKANLENPEPDNQLKTTSTPTSLAERGNSDEGGSAPKQL
ncbi:hypothetical protein NDU88_000412 [Pleurodeles waltl]|uniref:Uncharacterized protein n=1 Tax=Pleurodeles waltl TaxID=8319 RepID=A0AAV7VXG2_PLEWA|nr:hypothetical protein NDU88_000412 [Pleurodeles waltl]